MGSESVTSHRTGNREVTGSNPVEVLNFFQASLRNCISCVHCDDHFFIFISFPQFIYDLFHISLTYTVMIPLNSGITMDVTSITVTVFKVEKLLKHCNHSWQFC